MDKLVTWWWHNSCINHVVVGYISNHIIKEKGGSKMLELFKKILELISPQLRETIRKSLEDWKVAAEQTDSIVDDVLVLLITKLLGF